MPAKRRRCRWCGEVFVQTDREHELCPGCVEAYAAVCAIDGHSPHVDDDNSDLYRECDDEGDDYDEDVYPCPVCREPLSVDVRYCPECYADVLSGEDEDDEVA